MQVNKLLVLLQVQVQLQYPAMLFVIVSINIAAGNVCLLAHVFDKCEPE